MLPRESHARGGFNTNLIGVRLQPSSTMNLIGQLCWSADEALSRTKGSEVQHVRSAVLPSVVRPRDDMTSSCMHCSWCAKRIWILALGTRSSRVVVPLGLLVKIRQAFPLRSQSMKRWSRGASMREGPGTTWNFPRGETRLIVWNEDWDVNMKVALKKWRLNRCIFFYRFLFKDSYQRLYADQRSPKEKLYPSWRSMYLTLRHFGLSGRFSEVRRVIGLNGPSEVGTFPYDPVWISCAPQRKKWCLSQRP